MTLGAIALSVVYAAIVIAVSSPVSFYTLDDPYIHMALAENLARGHFGVNLGEVSNPSSSILWPWLLATAERIGDAAVGAAADQHRLLRRDRAGDAGVLPQASRARRGWGPQTS